MSIECTASEVGFVTSVSLRQQFSAPGHLPDGLSAQLLEDVASRIRKQGGMGPSLQHEEHADPP